MLLTSRQIYFYDDRCKTDDRIRLKEILYRNDNVCLCLTDQPDLGEVLFSMEDGEVLSNNLEHWYATNKERTDG